MSYHEAMRTQLKLCLVVSIASLLSCSAEHKKVESAAVDLASAACQLLDKQEEPGWLQFVCKGVEAGAGPAKSFIMRMPREKVSLSAAPCPSGGSK